MRRIRFFGNNMDALQRQIDLATAKLVGISRTVYLIEYDRDYGEHYILSDLLPKGHITLMQSQIEKCRMRIDLRTGKSNICSHGIQFVWMR